MSGAERIRTTHAGSLPRPTALTALHAARAQGEPIPDDALQAAIETATRDSVQKQLEVGLDLINNGEMGRESFFTYVRHRMTGFSGASRRRPMADLLAYPGFAERLARPAPSESVNLLRPPRATGEVRYRDAEPIATECAQLADILAERGLTPDNAFVSAPSPGIIAAAMENAHYPDLSAYVRAVADALRTEYRAILDAGFILQIDAPDLAMERHTLFQDEPLQAFLDFAASVVDATNRALDGLPPERIRLHVCWGNYEGPHDRDVPLEAIWDVIRELRAGALMLSMANPRHAHEVRLFERGLLPAETVLVPGVIDTTTHYVEHPETVADRIERVARGIGDPARVVAGTDCGFETAAGFVTVSADVAWQKLRALAEGAALATKRLFG